VSEHVDEIAAPESHLPHGRPLPWARKLADLLTLSRFLGGIALALMPWEKTVRSLGKLIKYNLLLWSTDAVDGRIARGSKTPSSWVGEHDAQIDFVLTLCTGIALARSGFLPGELIVVWLVACLMLYAIRPVATVLLAFMFPMQIALPALAFVYGCPEARLYVIWVAVVAFVSRKRLKWVIEVFINGLPDRQREWVWSWLPDWLRLTPEERESFQMSYTSDSAPLQARGTGLPH